MKVSQPAISQALKTAPRVQMPLPGRDSAGPYEVCLRYAAGQLTREQTIAQLSAWPYTQADTLPADGDDIVVIPPGTMHEVVEAKHAGLIDREMYGEFVREIAAS